MISSTGYSKGDIENLKDTAKSLGVNIVLFEDKDEFINYIDTGSISNSSNNRSNLKISSVTVFSHGLPGVMALGYNQSDESTIDITVNDLSKIKKSAFSTNANTMFYSCNAGTSTNNNGVSFAQAWANATGSKTTGAIGRTDYVPTVGDWNKNKNTIKKSRQESGYMEEGSFQYPGLGNNASWKVFTPKK
jgi:hypothetical protein